ncbi:MAG: hypothetical protein ACE5JQ_03570 [Candidatus Methylomirabilales bacterium]
MSDERVFTYSRWERLRYWVPITVSFLGGIGGFFLVGTWLDLFFWVAFWWFFTGYGWFLERARRQRPMNIITGDGGIAAEWKAGERSIIPWAEVSKVLVDQQPYRDDLKKIIVSGRPPSKDILFTHRINRYEELFQTIRQKAAQAEFEEVYLWRRKKIT